MKAGKFCNREVITSSRDTSIEEISKLMRKNHVGDIVIVDTRDGQPVPVGIITDRDIVMHVIAEGIDYHPIIAEDIMTLEMQVVNEDSSIWELHRLMREKGVRRVPVVNEDEVLVGIISIDDLLEIISRELSDLVLAINRGQIQEKDLHR